MYHTPPTNSPPQSLAHLDNHVFDSAKKFFGDMDGKREIMTVCVDNGLTFLDVHQLKYLTHDMIEKVIWLQ